MAFSPWTENILLYAAAAPSWYVWMLYGDRSRNKAIGLFVIVLLWTALAFAVVRYGFDAPLLGAFAGRTLIYLVVPCGLAFLFRRWLTTPALSQHVLVSLQLFRVIGTLFVVEWARGTLPAIFALPAGLGDLAVSVIAAAILFRYRDQAIPRPALLLLAYAGIADFVSAFFFGFTSSASPVQIFSLSHPNLVDTYPTGLIPEFLVPFAVIAHILSLTELARTSPDDVGSQELQRHTALR